MRVVGIYRDGSLIRVASLKKNKKNILIEGFATYTQGVLPPLQKAHIISGLDAKATFIRSLIIPLKKKRAVRLALPFQAENLFPIPSEEILLFPLLSSLCQEGTEVTLIASSKKALEDHINFWKEKQIDPEWVSSVPVALSRAAAFFLPNVPTLIVLHIGMEKSSAVFIRENKIVSSQTLGVCIEELELALREDLPFCSSEEIAEKIQQLHLAEISKEQFPSLFKKRECFAKELERTLFFFGEKSSSEEPLGILLLGEQKKMHLYEALNIEPPFFLLQAEEAVAKLRVRRFSEAFWPIFDSFLGGNIRRLILPPKKESKIGSKIPENRLNLSFATASEVNKKNLESVHAIPLGFCLDVLNGKENAVQFRMGPLTSPAQSFGLLKKIMAFGAVSLFLSLSLLVCGHFFIAAKQKTLERQLEKLVEKPLEGTLQEKIENVSSALSKDQEGFIYYSNAPKVSDLLAWVARHPSLVQEGPIEIKRIHYSLFSYPKIGKGNEPYKAFVEIDFIASTPTAAREFHDALLQGDELVNPKGKIGWEVRANNYQTSFYLKNR